MTDSSRNLPAVYVLACSDGSLYTGATVDLERRLIAHRRGTAAKYTRGRLPVALVGWWHPPTFALAKSHEARFKRLRRAAKLAALNSGLVYGCVVHRQSSSRS
ncbi:MAG: GIY-YIG nuclease family protein [Candidatus Cybelea sp.]